MKYILSFLLIFITFYSSTADCGSSGIQIFPTENTIWENSRIMIQGDFSYFEYLETLGKEYSIQLKNEEQSINLILEEVCKTEASYLQLFFKPETKLTAGKKYKLNIELPPKLKDYTLLSGINSHFKREFEWTVSNKKTSKPYFKKEPKLVEKKFVAYGCGPEIFAIFDYKLNNNNEVLFLTELIEIESNFTQMAYIPSFEGKIKVGHGMCQGAFRYSCRSKKYKVRFRIMDAAGNFSRDWTDWIKFDEPKYSS